jgi:succinate dehydrogenase/fumarate reductase flavoprotein subunit
LKELMIDAQGKVVGAICERYNGAKLVVHTTKGVVLATGGYARNRDMVIPYYPVGDDYFSNIPRGQVGDGLVAAEKIGAKNFKHPAIQTVYTSLTNGIGINDESGLIVNEFGNRVVNEWTYQ